MPPYPENPDYYSEPTQAARYGGYYDEPTPEPEPPTPWYRRPAALVAAGAIGVILLGAVVFAVVKLATGSPAHSPATTTSPPPSAITTTVTTTTAEAPRHHGGGGGGAPTQTVTETALPPSTDTGTPSTDTGTPSTDTGTPSTNTGTTTVPPSTVTASPSTETSTVTQTVTVPPHRLPFQPFPTGP